MKKKEQDYAALLQERKYDPNKILPKENVVFVIEQKNIGTLQNFVTITGMQKSGKTRFMSIMIASALTNTPIFDIWIHLPEEKRRVCYWDTEQGDHDFYNTMAAIKTFCQTDTLPPHFDAFNLREDEPATIILMIEKYLQLHPDCGLIVIDGLLDLIERFNDDEQSKKLVNILKRITKTGNQEKDCKIPRGNLGIFTLHKGKTTSNTLGHLGSMADRAAQSILVVEKNKEQNTFLLKADFLRSADDFTPIEIFFNKGSHQWEQTIYNPERDNPIKKQQLKPHELDKEMHESNVRKIFMLQEDFEYKELVQNISEFYARSRDWSRACLNHLMDEKLIFKVGTKYTNRRQAKLFIQQ